MSVLLTSALLASVATAQLTTYIWMPGAARANQSFVGSVVSQQNDRTTLALTFDGAGIETEYYRSGPDLVTVGGITYVGFGVSATDLDSFVTATVNFECSRADVYASPTCTATTKIDGTAASTISGLGAAQTTTTLSNYGRNFLNEFKLIITAGTEKLSASAIVTPTPTASGPSPTGSSAQSSEVSAASEGSSAGSSGVAQATGAAAPMRSLAPVLAGMGAAAAFFV